MPDWNPGLSVLYDTIGIDYACLRKPDPRIAARIDEALGQAKSVLNVGAGTGSYEPTSREVTALEPSVEMIRQRTVPAARVVQGHAEALPFADNSFDAAMAVLTVHHWTDRQQGLRELRRVARGPIVILTFDAFSASWWLNDYIPELVALDRQQMPAIAEYERWLGSVRIEPVPIPHDCSDGFLAAYWRRPAAYLDPKVRKAISAFWMIGDVSRALARLEKDLQCGDWLRRHGGLLEQHELDCGYRLVVTE